MTRKTSILLPFLIFAVMSGAAHSAETYATEDYVDEQFADLVGYVDGKNRTLTSRMTTNNNQLFANQEVLRDMLNEKDASGNWLTLDTEAQLAIPAINELKAALDAKADAADVDLTGLNSAIEALETGKATVADLEALQNTVDALGNTYATDAELSAQIDAVKDLIPSVSDFVLATDLAKVATTGSYADLKDKPTIPSIEGLASSQDLTNLQTALEAEIAKKQAKGDYLVAADLTTLNNAITALQSGKADASTVTTIQETISKLGDTYASKADMTAADEALQAAIDAINVPSLEGYVKAADLAAVATSGSYDDLSNKPTIPSIEGLASSQDLTNLQTALEAEIAKKQAAGDYLVAADLTTLNNAITALQSGKADTSTVTTIQETISKLGDTYATDEELSAAIAAIDLTPFAKVADVESALALKENAANKVATATAEQIDAMSSDEKSTKFPSISVAQTIANAAVTKVNEVAGDLSTLQTQVGTNTADIAEIKAAGYQTADDVQGAITTATADLAAKADVYTKAQVDTAISAIKEYDDTALAARVSTNETNIATNADAIAALQNAGFVAGAKTAGSYLVNFDASGNVSYASVEIVDDRGNPIDLTTGAIN